MLNCTVLHWHLVNEFALHSNGASQRSQWSISCLGEVSIFMWPESGKTESPERLSFVNKKSESKDEKTSFNFRTCADFLTFRLLIIIYMILGYYLCRAGNTTLFH
ncbi:hypothetical protein ACVW0P_003709 [Mucilaginibacter sp. UYNi724]